MNIDEFIHIYEPPKRGCPRTFLALHGTGGDENSLTSVAKALDGDAGILSVRGKVLENGAPRFFRRLSEGVFDLEDLMFRAHQLADYIEVAAEATKFDLSGLVAVGYSNGANIASSLLFLRPGVLAGAVLFRAMVPFEPSKGPDLNGKRVFLSEGKFDPIVPPNDAERLSYLLCSLGADVSLNWSPLDHRLGRDEIDAASEWLKQA